MGWFNKKEKKIEKKVPLTLPELPKLPELPPIEDETTNKNFIHQLPTFPNNSIGEKFSQDTIKDAVTGKEDGEGVLDADELAKDKTQEMPKPLKNSLTKELSFPERRTSYKVKTTQEAEPIFVRIDKFEESLELFEKSKERLLEINEMLKEIKKIKQEEEEQLNSWEREMQIVKQEIEKIDKGLFSKL